MIASNQPPCVLIAEDETARGHVDQSARLPVIHPEGPAPTQQ